MISVWRYYCRQSESPTQLPEYLLLSFPLSSRSLSVRIAHHGPPYTEVPAAAFVGGTSSNELSIPAVVFVRRVPIWSDHGQMRYYIIIIVQGHLSERT